MADTVVTTPEKTVVVDMDPDRRHGGGDWYRGTERLKDNSSEHDHRNADRFGNTWHRMRDYGTESHDRDTTNLVRAVEIQKDVVIATEKTNGRIGDTEGRLGVQAEKIAAAVALQAEKHAAAITLAQTQNQAALALAMCEAEASRARFTAELKAQAAECCCELKELIREQAAGTNGLINGNTIQDLRDKAASLEARLLRVPPLVG